MDNIKGISLINNISKYLYIFASTISIIFVCILFYILIGGSFEGLINVDTIINDSESSSQYSNFNQVPLGSRFIGFLLAVLIIGFTLTILKLWKNFISLVNQGKYFEVSTLKNLKYISYFLFGIGTSLFLIEIFTDMIFSTSASFSNESALNDKNIADNVVNIESSFSLSPIMLLLNGIVIWVLSHILIEGMRIKKESELTI
tara:strand:+ start:1573 stop:2178 length:606 start_codon:yes stop_codon:yes gene_type:complete